MPEYEDLLDAGQAAQYLAEKWGIDSYTTDAFKMLRHRWNIEPVILIKNASLWRKSDLDKIPMPDRSRPRGKRVKKEASGDDGTPSVMLMSFRKARPLVA